MEAEVFNFLNIADLPLLSRQKSNRCIVSVCQGRLYKKGIRRQGKNGRELRIKNEERGFEI